MYVHLLLILSYFPTIRSSEITDRQMRATKVAQLVSKIRRHDGLQRHEIYAKWSQNLGTLFIMFQAKAATPTWRLSSVTFLIKLLDVKNAVTFRSLRAQWIVTLMSMGTARRLPTGPMQRLFRVTDCGSNFWGPEVTTLSRHGMR
jgi:hypothetical protein